jgi:dTDP-4-dehydrorhamnose reductase
MSERMLVVGGSGQIGGAVVHRLDDSDRTVEFTYRRTNSQIGDLTTYQLDIRDRARTTEVITQIEPDVVVHAAAATDVDRCETDPELAQAVNLEGTKHVVEACQKVNSHLVALSTAYVFGEGTGPYKVSDARCPINTYGQSKAASERIVLSSDLRTTILRTDQPYGRRREAPGADFVSWVLNNVEQNGQLNVYDDWYGAPTHVDDIAKAVQRITTNHHLGIFHCVGPTYLSRFTWAKQIASAFDHDPASITAVSSDGGDHPAKRPESKLVTDGSNERLGIDPISCVEGLDVMQSKSATTEISTSTPEHD